MEVILKKNSRYSYIIGSSTTYFIHYWSISIGNQYHNPCPEELLNIASYPLKYKTRGMIKNPNFPTD